jgi:hypothetical protein
VQLLRRSPVWCKYFRCHCLALHKLTALAPHQTLFSGFLTVFYARAVAGFISDRVARTRGPSSTRYLNAARRIQQALERQYIDAYRASREISGVTWLKELEILRQSFIMFVMPEFRGWATPQSDSSLSRAVAPWRRIHIRILSASAATGRYLRRVDHSKCTGIFWVRDGIYLTSKATGRSRGRQSRIDSRVGQTLSVYAGEVGFLFVNLRRFPAPKSRTRLWTTRIARPHRCPDRGD